MGRLRVGGRRPLVGLALLGIGLIFTACAPNPGFSDNGTITRYSLSTSVAPEGIALGPDGNLWVADNATNDVNRVTPAGVSTAYPLTATAANPVDVVAGPDGNLWVTESGGTSPGNGNVVDRVTTAGVVTPYTTTVGAQPFGIATDGTDVWFTEKGLDRIAKIDPGTGTVIEYPIVPTPTGLQPEGIALGPDGNLWFTEYGRNAIGKITPAGVITEYVINANSAQLIGITAGPDGNVWFVDALNNLVEKSTTAGVVTSYPLPAAPGGPPPPIAQPGMNPVDIVTGPDGNLWVTTAGGNVVRVTTSGTITSFPIPAPTSSNPGGPIPEGISRGPGNSLWFTENGDNDVATFDPVPVITSLSPTSGAAAGGQTVTINCTGCKGATTVTWGGTAITATPCPATPTAPCFDVNSAGTAITLQDDPAGTAGASVQVTFTTPYGVSAAATFGYAAAVVTPSVPVPSTGGGLALLPAGLLLALAGCGLALSSRRRRRRG